MPQITIDNRSCYLDTLSVKARAQLTSLQFVDAELARLHGLTGNWAGYRECHMKPDLLLIYSKPEPDTLRLARLGSHSELFG